MQTFHRRHIDALGPVLARFRVPPPFAEETAQLVAERLLVPVPPEPPRIAAYAGEGPLASWVAVAATRVALSRLRQLGREQRLLDPSSASANILLAAPADPELDVLKERYRPALQRALREAIQTLPARERILLRLSLIEGVSLQKIGRSYGVDASTVCRWLASARERLLEKIRAHFQQNGPVGATELASVVRLVRSQVDISLSGWQSGS